MKTAHRTVTGITISIYNTTPREMERGQPLKLFCKEGRYLDLYVKYYLKYHEGLQGNQDEDYRLEREKYFMIKLVIFNKGINI